MGNMGLVGQGVQQQDEAMRVMGEAAKQEQERKMANKQNEANRKQGNMSAGATAGAMVGTAVGGPWGAIIGGAIGAIAGNYF